MSVELTNLDDTYFGSPDAEEIIGMKGDDIINGNGGLDTLCGWSGDDILISLGSGGVLSGDEGNDYLEAEKITYGQYHMYGGEGNDTLVMHMDNQTGWGEPGFHVYGGDGADEFHFMGVENTDMPMVSRVESFDPSQDSIWVDGQLIDLNNLPADMRIVEYCGQQWLQVGTNNLIGLEGARLDPDSSTGEEIHMPEFPSDIQDLPTVDFVDQGNFVPLDLYSSSLPTLTSIDGDADVVNGTAGDDYVYGEKAFSYMSLESGDDVVDAGKGNDTVDGGSGNDLIAGGTDSDRLLGGSGSDQIWGGSESDTVKGNEAKDFLFGGGGADWIFGGTSDDKIYGDVEYEDFGGSDSLFGGGGGDSLLGGFGRDLLSGGGGIDCAQYTDATSGVWADLAKSDANLGFAAGDIYFSIENLVGSNYDDVLRGNNSTNELWGDSGNDELVGREGNDILHGGSGNDLLNGGDGSDRLKGEKGSDQLQGGAGSDQFIFDDKSGSDTILDFEWSGDVDVIDFSSVASVTDFEDLAETHMQQVNTDVVIRLDGQNSVRILNTDLTDLNSGDFIF